MQDNEFQGRFRVTDRLGLHAGPSLEIVKKASLYQSEIYLVHQKRSVSAKSLLSILMLTAKRGSQIVIKAKGADAQEAVESIVNLFPPSKSLIRDSK